MSPTNMDPYDGASEVKPSIFHGGFASNIPCPVDDYALLSPPVLSGKDQLSCFQFGLFKRLLVICRNLQTSDLSWPKSMVFHDVSQIRITKLLSTVLPISHYMINKHLIPRVLELLHDWI